MYGNLYGQLSLEYNAVIFLAINSQTAEMQMWCLRSRSAHAYTRSRRYVAWCAFNEHVPTGVMVIRQFTRLLVIISDEYRVFDGDTFHNL